MTIPDSILVAVDLTPASDAVMRQARWLAQRPEIQRIWLLHVIDVRMLDGIASLGLGLRAELEVSARAAAMDALERLAQQLRDAGSHEVEIVCRAGRPDTELAAVVKQVAPGLVIAGAGNRLWRQALLGSTVRRLLRLLHRPLWLVRGSAERGYERVMLGSDLDLAAARGANIASRYWPAAQFEVMHVEEDIDELLAGLPAEAGFDTASLLAERQERGEQRLAHFISENLPGVRSVARLEHGHPVAMLLQRTRDQKPDLLVLGRSGRDAHAGALGSVAEGLVDLVDCDLLLVPAD